ncbi:hypothetical protein I3842_Q111800 [Carya illinoinensis]|uniref:Uncharacterized protein n=1 Tax=Carya illinoinensis TaxID=32201 RepID=A0A921ZXS4_CARIL|nr:hypothetical protein I3842_Q111800 [Carya illinoinensis]
MQHELHICCELYNKMTAHTHAGAYHVEQQRNGGYNRRRNGHNTLQKNAHMQTSLRTALTPIHTWSKHADRIHTCTHADQTHMDNTQPARYRTELTHAADQPSDSTHSKSKHVDQ